MKKKCLIKLLSLSLVAMLVHGCCSTASSDKVMQVKPKKEACVPSNLSQCKDVEQAGQIMVESVINGLDSGNYEMYIRDFTDESKKSFTNEIFQDACKAVESKLGKIKTKQYLCNYQKNGYWVLLWKAKYSKINEDILLELYVKRSGNGYKTAAFVPK